MQDIELDDMDPSILTSGMPENQGNPTRCGNDNHSQGRLFTIQAAISDINQETTSPHKQETSPSIDHVMIDESQIIQETNSENNMNASGMPENQQNPIGCVPGINMVLKTIQKYMKNTMISLLIVTCLLPANLLLIYGFITNSGCENPTVRAFSEICEYGWYLFNMLLPFLIKLKLDRLSE